MMRKAFSTLLFLATALCLTNAVQAALVGLNGTRITELYSSVGTYCTIGGLDLRDGQLYFGQNKTIRSLNPKSTSLPLVSTEIADIGYNVGTSIVIAQPNSDTLYTAYGSSYDAPYPYNIGSIDNSGTFTLQNTIGGVYDAAVASNGQLYVTANPDIDGDEENDGTQVLRYDWTNGSVETIFEIGGSSGGLTFDKNGNLYVADYEHDRILSFSADTVANANSIEPLTIDNASSNVTFNNPSYLAVDSVNGYLYVSYSDESWNTYVKQVDLANPYKQINITSGGGKMILNDDGDLYMIDTDYSWDNYGSTINLVSVASAPEPSTFALLLVGLTCLAIFCHQQH